MGDSAVIAQARANLDSADGAQIRSVVRIEVEEHGRTSGQLWLVRAELLVSTDWSATGTPAYQAVARLLGAACLDAAEAVAS